MPQTDLSIAEKYKSTYSDEEVCPGCGAPSRWQLRELPEGAAKYCTFYIACLDGIVGDKTCWVGPERETLPEARDAWNAMCKLVAFARQYDHARLRVGINRGLKMNEKTELGTEPIPEREGGPPTFCEQLYREHEYLRKRLGEVNRAIDLLENSPDLRQAMDVLSKLAPFRWA